MALQVDATKTFPYPHCTVCDKIQLPKNNSDTFVSPMGNFYYTTEQVSVCARCHITQYCSRDCQKKDWNAHKTTCKETNLPPRNEINVFVQQFCKDLRSPISHRQYIHITIVNGKLTGTLKPASSFLDFGTFYAELNETWYSFKLAAPVSLVREKYVKPASLPDLSHLDETEQSFVRKLADMHIDDILDEGEGQRTCRNLRIEIFNYFKEKNGGNSIAGKRGMQKICEPLKSHRNGTLVQHISRAWNRVGDDKDLRGMWIA